MLTKLMKSLTPPPLYETGSHPFWTDEHISAQMLKAHLDPEFESASRKLSFIENSAAWIRDLVPPPVSPVILDVGCGPGIYAEKFAHYGYSVTGIDFSPRSINYAQASAKSNGLNIRYICTDYLNMALNEQYDFATMIYCDYGALSTADRKKLMGILYQHLKPGGKLLLDVFSVEVFRSFQESRTWEHCPDGGFWNNRAYAALHSGYKYSDHIILEQTVVVTNNDIFTYNIWKTCFTKDLLIQEATEAGFRVCEIYGDVAGTAFSETCPTIAILLEK